MYSITMKKVLLSSLTEGSERSNNEECPYEFGQKKRAPLGTLKF
jgi:hypothetical protein